MLLFQDPFLNRRQINEVFLNLRHDIGLDKVAQKRRCGNALRLFLKIDRVFEQDDIGTLNYALQQVTQPGATGETAGYLGRPVAGKTGTSSDTKSAWFIGYIPQMLTVVDMYQVGEDGSEEELQDFGYQFISGGTYPSDIWLGLLDLNQ